MGLCFAPHVTFIPIRRFLYSKTVVLLRRHTGSSCQAVGAVTGHRAPALLRSLTRPLPREVVCV